MQPLPDRRVFHLATNDLSCLFETDTDFLRRIKRGQTEIIRAIYAAVRDENWNISLVQGGLDFNFPGTSLALIR